MKTILKIFIGIILFALLIVGLLVTGILATIPGLSWILVIIAGLIAIGVAAGYLANKIIK